MRSQGNRTHSPSRPSRPKPKKPAASRAPLRLVASRTAARPARSRRVSLILYALVIGAAALVIGLLYAAAPVHADTSPLANADPMSDAKVALDQTIAVFRDKSLSEPDRRQKLRTIAEANFDFAAMARSACGYHWRALSDDQRREFVPLFTTFIEDVALSQIEKYSVQKVQQNIQTSVIAWNRQQVDGDTAEVFSTVTLTDRAQPIQVTYLMKRVGNDWKFYDIDVDAISVIANYRNQFNRVLNDQGYDKLVSILREKSQQLGSTLATQ